MSDSSPAPAAVSLPADLGIDVAGALYRDLLARVDHPGLVTLDAQDVARIHTAALQLFCMFCQDRRAAGRETQWHQPTEALRSAAALLGVTTLLQLARQDA
ncbi:STAS domain-containing protein [Solimonas sp. K1W22B-7]|uniref:STAS domain-containing protein n=1 Tax=Solimonas sp. K1W22B-7 TaxID=2303331 RepID=UPI0013C46EAE|nr:STAS domain-containing protein [Solimonas sp. K1W22B-7]